MKYVLTAVILAVAFASYAQSVTDTPPTKGEVPKAEAKKPAAKKKAPTKPLPSKAVTPAKPAAKPAAPAVTKVYTNDPKAPVVRDKQGNAIPTNPDAYDVSSAIGKK